MLLSSLQQRGRTRGDATEGTRERGRNRKRVEPQRVFTKHATCFATCTMFPCNIALANKNEQHVQNNNQNNKKLVTIFMD